MEKLEDILEGDEITENRLRHRRRFCASVKSVILINNLFNKNTNGIVLPKPSLTENDEITRKRSRVMSVENTTLTEVITAYEKLKKGRDNAGIILTSSRTEPCMRIDIDFNEAEETEPTFNIPIDKQNNAAIGSSRLYFNSFKLFKPMKYIYFSESATLLQADSIELLSTNYAELLQAKNYWLNIFNPNELDFSILFHSYGVHDLTINDIREGNTEEKMEVYKHYTFISLRLMSENKSVSGIKSNNNAEDVDFNIILFKDFIITLHDKKWPSIKDILEFLNLLSTNSQSLFMPDWVLFSCFVEMNQDAKGMMEVIEPEVNNIRMESKSVELTDIVIMRRNFDMELQLYTVSRFIKPKIRILRLLKLKCSKRLDKIVLRLLGDILEDFRELSHDLHHFNHMLERSQDTFLALVSSNQSRDANEMNRIMQRMSEFALVCIPIQVIGSFFGMNVSVPFHANYTPETIPFYIILGGSLLLSTIVFIARKTILKTSYL